MKLPAYLKLEPTTNSGRKPGLHYNLTIKKWGIPILVFKVLKENYKVKWYQWLLYPVLCIKIMLKRI